MIKAYVVPVRNPSSGKYSVSMYLRGNKLPLTFDVFNDKQEAFEYARTVSSQISVVPEMYVPLEGTP